MKYLVLGSISVHQLVYLLHFLVIKMNGDDGLLLSVLSSRCNECSKTFTASSAPLRKQKSELLTQFNGEFCFASRILSSTSFTVLLCQNLGKSA